MSHVESSRVGYNDRVILWETNLGCSRGWRRVRGIRAGRCADWCEPPVQWVDGAPFRLVIVLAAAKSDRDLNLFSVPPHRQLDDLSSLVVVQKGE